MQKMIFHLTILLSVILLFSFFEREALADQSFNILIVHAENDDNNTIENMKRVFLYYTETVHVTSDITEYVLSDYTHLVLISPHEQLGDSDLEQINKNFSGIIIKLGIPIEYSKQPKQTTTIIDISTPYIHGFMPIMPINRVYETEWSLEVEKVLLGRNYIKEEIPLLIRENSIYYLLTKQVTSELVPFLIEGFRKELNYRSVLSTQYHLQITDVNPLVDLDNLIQLTDLLMERDIPFSLAVLPIVIRESDNKHIYIKDNKDLVQLLQKLQSNGNPILVQQSLVGGETYPLEYMLEKLVKSKMYPIGIYYTEKPLLLNELSIIKNHSSTIIATIYTDFESGGMAYQPAQIKGKQELVLIPFPLPVEQDLISFGQKWRLALRSLSVLPDQQVSILFPAFESMKKLEVVVDLLEEEKGQWLNLLQFVHFLEVDNITIFYDDRGYLVIDDIPFISAFKRNISLSIFEVFLWALAGLILVSVLVFGGNSWKLRLKRRQLLFKEKKLHG